ncbi:hypothetical protein BCPG3_055 [Bacillus phage BCPG3]|uniref:Uncharacterized protein n=3 Tax=Wphvirus TaxID=1922327 RepID=W5QUH5_9CAUD|nr:hypothetical protein BPS13_0037 [Bacillus phage BPS13]YP_009002922.1 hypothetical protein BPS10C_036 [Bacillus phage BPS10C]YP_009281991.1 hypothetical protein SALINJAH_37 [Bacillus phage SalinJah]QQO38948.1 hypothetical protein BCPG1_217 [Bacillus phage BCPG1]QSJ04372.1 hypothetical protein BCPG3_055 [Bacillus phage BCPG3]QSJ04585.1 hypothetical protein BCP18_053 [Bacillus phage BCP18]AEZ50216.1 hypothetical protein BPS13_0037 [Bacillus phage BPS13]AGI12033.1 hypothetical protein BPS10C_
MLRKHDRVWLVEPDYKYEGLIGIVQENPYKGKVWVKMREHESSVIFPVEKVKLLERPFIPFFEAISIAEEEDVLVCEYAGYQNIVCDDKYAFTWEESQKTVKLVGEFIGMKWKIAQEAF